MRPYHFVFWSVAATAALAQTITIYATDERVQYSGIWERPSVCAHIGEGEGETPNQPGCYNLGANQCADNFTLARHPRAAASLTFRGSGISVHTLSQPDSTVAGRVFFTLEGTETSALTAPSLGRITCLDPIFSEGDLDGSVDHTLEIVLQNDSPSDGPLEEGLFLALTHFEITGGTTSQPSPSISATGTRTNSETVSGGDSSATSPSSTTSGTTSSPAGPSASTIPDESNHLQPGLYLLALFLATATTLI